MERLQKYLANCGVDSRRNCEELILDGRVKVNGEIVTELGIKVDPEKDVVEYKGKVIKKDSENIYILLNKPKNVISSVKDPQGRKTVIDLLNNKYKRVYPVGRLDYESEGLILLTDDGEFANKITHPRNKVEKTYEVWVYGYPNKEKLERFSTGVTLEEGKTLPAKVKVKEKLKSSTILEVKIKEGKKRQIRRMFDVLGHPVSKLVRTQIGELKLGKIDPGKYRELNEKDIKRIFMTQKKGNVRKR